MFPLVGVFASGVNHVYTCTDGVTVVSVVPLKLSVLTGSVGYHPVKFSK
jgi:hypothetical protein